MDKRQGNPKLFPSYHLMFPKTCNLKTAFMSGDEDSYNMCSQPNEQRQDNLFCSSLKRTPAL